MAVSSPALSLTNVLTLTEWEKDSETFIDELVSVGAKENTNLLDCYARMVGDDDEDPASLEILVLFDNAKGAERVMQALGAKKFNGRKPEVSYADPSDFDQGEPVDYDEEGDQDYEEEDYDDEDA